jgi:peptide-methionine (S)-S-oxide reductase
MIVLMLAVLAVSPTSGGTVDSVEVATLGAGCFWCVEAVYQRLEGVISVEPGFAGGSVDNPTYDQVCTGSTGHAEVAQITFDPRRISFAKLLEVFWEAHDPTTLNRQGADVGTQYRSIIFAHSAAQRETAEHSRTDAQKNFSSPIVTAIEPFTAFYKAEDYHRDYYRNHMNAPYCRFVIKPKVEKVQKELKKMGIKER